MLDERGGLARQWRRTSHNTANNDDGKARRMKNIVQPDGRYCFVLTNGARAPGAIIGEKEIKRSNSNNVASIVFYNEEGDENGGLITAGRMKEDGTYYGSSRLVFDRFRRDETLAFQYYEDAIGGYSGILLQDTPDMFTSEWLEGNETIRAMS